MHELLGDCTFTNKKNKNLGNDMSLFGECISTNKKQIKT